MLRTETPNVPDRAARLAKARDARPNSAKTTEISAQNRFYGLEAARKSAIYKRVSEMPKIYKKTYLRAVSGKSPKAAIKAFCLECVGWQREEVAHCTAPACPLYAYRPFRR